MTNTQLASPQTHRRQMTLIFLCWAVYTVAYFGRSSYSANITLIMDDYGVSHQDAGLVSTLFFFVYGVGQLVNGLLCRHYSRRWIFPAALAVSAAVNLLLFVGVPFPLIKYLWFINGAAQSFLWPSLMLVLGESLDKQHLERSVLIMGTTVSVGTLLTYVGSSLFAHLGQYRFSFLLGAAPMLLVAVLWVVFYAPTGAGPDPLERVDAPSAASPEQKRRIEPAVLLVIVLLGLFAVVNNLVREGEQTWVPTVLKETFRTSDSFSILLSLILPVLGTFGAALAAVIRRKIGNFVTLSTLFSFLTVLCTAAILAMLQTSLAGVVAAFGLSALLMHALNSTITSIAPLYLRRHANPGMLAGVLNACCYVGSTISSYGLGALADHSGWPAVFRLMLGALALVSVIGAAYMLTLGKKAKQD